MSITYEPIGIIRSSHRTTDGIPIQSSGAKGCRGSVILHSQFTEGLSDLEGFSHIILIYHFHQTNGYELKPTPFLDIKPYAPEFNIFEVEKTGWLENKGGNINEIKSDKRFQ